MVPTNNRYGISLLGLGSMKWSLKPQTIDYRIYGLETITITDFMRVSISVYYLISRCSCRCLQVWCLNAIASKVEGPF